jgi:hypothetical protein
MAYTLYQCHMCGETQRVGPFTNDPVLCDACGSTCIPEWKLKSADRGQGERPKVVQIAVAHYSQTADILYALRDDGNIFVRPVMGVSSRWTPIPDIPEDDDAAT